MKNSEDLLTVEEALSHLKAAGITQSIKTVRYYIRQKQLPAHLAKPNDRRSGYRIKRTDLDNFIASRIPIWPEYVRLKKLEAEKQI
jgi:hypothetical protein